MFLEPVPNSIHRPVRMKCDQCGNEYIGRAKTANKQMEKYGMHRCANPCMRIQSGQIAGARNKEWLSAKMSGDGNFAKKDGIGKKISEAKKGVLFSEEHKAALHKPKSKVKKIIEAANRPGEVERRSKLMTERLAAGWIPYGECKPFESSKTVGEITCRSKFERWFLDEATVCDGVVKIKSAEHLKLEYYVDGRRHRYLPDFKITDVLNHVYIVEMKGYGPSCSFYDMEKIEAKKAILFAYCVENGYESRFFKSKREVRLWLEQLHALKPHPAP